MLRVAEVTAAGVALETAHESSAEEGSGRYYYVGGEDGFSGVRYDAADYCARAASVLVIET